MRFTLSCHVGALNNSPFVRVASRHVRQFGAGIQRRWVALKLVGSRIVQIASRWLYYPSAFSRSLFIFAEFSCWFSNCSPFWLTWFLRQISDLLMTFLVVVKWAHLRVAHIILRRPDGLNSVMDFVEALHFRLSRWHYLLSCKPNPRDSSDILVAWFVQLLSDAFHWSFQLTWLASTFRRHLLYLLIRFFHHISCPITIRFVVVLRTFSW